MVILADNYELDSKSNKKHITNNFMDYSGAKNMTRFLVFPMANIKFEYKIINYKR